MGLAFVRRVRAAPWAQLTAEGLLRCLGDDCLPNQLGLSAASSTLTLPGKLNQHLLLSHAELFVPGVYYSVSRFDIFLEFSVVRSP